MAGRGDIFGGSWQDEGLYFTLLVHGGFGFFFLLLAVVFHRYESIARILRPARPFSLNPRFGGLKDSGALFQRDENEIAMRVSVRAAIELLFLKYRAHIFIGGLFTATILTILCGTDGFISTYAERHDSFDCKARNSSSGCDHVGWCSWNSTSLTCEATKLQGLYDLTLLNLTPTHYRSWLVGCATVVFHLWFAYCIIILMSEIRILVFANKTMPVQHQTHSEALVARLGSRTVRVRVTDEQCRTFDGTARSLFPTMKMPSMSNIVMNNRDDVEPTATSAISAVNTSSTEEKEKEKEKDKKKKGENNNNDDDEDEKEKKKEQEEKRKAREEESELFHDLIDNRATNTVIAYLPPKLHLKEDDRSLVELIEEEEKILDEIKEATATQLFSGGEKKATKRCGTIDCLEDAQQRLRAVHSKMYKLEAPGSRYTHGKVSSTEHFHRQNETGAVTVHPATDLSAEREAVAQAQAQAAAAAKAKQHNHHNSKYSKNYHKSNSPTTILNPIAAAYDPWKVGEISCAFISFDSSLHASKFLKILLNKDDEDNNNNSDVVSSAMDFNEENCAIAGPRTHIDYNNLTTGNVVKSESNVVENLMKILAVILYIFLLFFATAVVGFFGNIDNIASLPYGASDVFGPIISNMPTSIFRILQAYLPLILLVLFQLVLPYIVRSTIISTFRYINYEEKENMSFRMIFIYLFVSGVLLQTCLQGGLFQLASVIWRQELGDVLTFIVALFTPKGGYFFALVAASTTFSQMMQLFQPGYLSHAAFIASREQLPEKQKVNTTPRQHESDLYAALSLMMFGLGCIFHASSPLLSIFVALYFITAYYSTRTVFFDCEDRNCKTNPATETTMHNMFALSQMRYTLILHTLATYGTFFLMNVKLLWGGAVVSVVTIIINAYLWHLKFSMYDTMLYTEDKHLQGHYDALQSCKPSSVLMVSPAVSPQTSSGGFGAMNSSSNNNAAAALGGSNMNVLENLEEHKICFLPPFSQYRNDDDCVKRVTEEVEECLKEM